MDQTIPLQIPQQSDSGETFRRDCMVAIAINADFLFSMRPRIDDFTLGKLNSYSSVSNQIKAIASFPTTWVSLYMMMLDSITNGRRDDFVSPSSTYELHQFLSNAYWPNADRPDKRTVDNDLNMLIESWYTRVFKIYLLSDLVSPKLNDLVKVKKLDQLIMEEIASYKSSSRGQSIESKFWCQTVRN